MSSSGLLYTIYSNLPLSVQNMMVTHAGSRRWNHETSPVFQKLVARLYSDQHSCEDVITERRRELLCEVLLAAKNTDFYKSSLPDSTAIRSNPMGVLSSIGVLDKETVRVDFKRFINPKFKGKLIQHGTSGTTGTPLQVIWTQKCIDMERALIWRQRKVTGLLFGKVWRGMLGGYQIVPLSQKKPPFWRVNKKAKQLYFSTYHLTPETGLSYLQALKQYEVRALEGYPSVLYALAHCLNENGVQYKLDSIYYGAEPLQDYQRAMLEKVFQCYVWDYYGLTERVASASEFECKNGLHENWENCILEIVDSSGNPVPDGEYGELVGTSLSNLGFPLLRYRTGDMTRFLPGKCSCGRDSRRIARIDTKREDLLLMPDGSLLSASNLTFPFKEVDNILESQIYQESVDKIFVRIVPAETYSSDDGDQLVAGLKKFVPENVAVQIVTVEEIPRTASGKFRFCISELTGR